VVQGVAVGGEWGGATLMAAEHARSRRGMWASMVNAGAPIGLVLSTLVLSLTAAPTTEAQFLEWGWRIAFLGSVVLLVVGVVVRRTVAESPLFRADRAPRDRFPLGLLVRRHPRRLLVGIGVGFGAFALQGTVMTFVLAYGTQVGLTRPTILAALTWASLAAVVGIVGFAALSDRWGRRPVFVTGAIAAAGFAFGTAQTVGVSALLAVSLLASAACALTLPETSHTDLADVPDRSDGA
jgi:MFS family permease